MNNYIIFTLAFIAEELVALIVFNYIRNYFDKKHNNAKASKLSILKGGLERFIILISLYNNLPNVLTVFGALKIGTRLKEDQDNRISNDYFLVGNMASLLIVLTTYLMIK